MKIISIDYFDVFGENRKMSKKLFAQEIFAGIVGEQGSKFSKLFKLDENLVVTVFWPAEFKSSIQFTVSATVTWVLGKGWKNPESQGQTEILMDRVIN